MVVAREHIQYVILYIGVSNFCCEQLHRAKLAETRCPY